MYYLHRYFSVYEPSELASCPVSLGILQVSILSLSLKVITQEYILEHLEIKEQLALFNVEVPKAAGSAPSADVEGKLKPQASER